ncbi:MAG TPA: TonB-dependent receptor, partial [Sphingomicrobium sp.]|nr:TonB-dependent receptor [Sphingomicrobium sp.]
MRVDYARAALLGTVAAAALIATPALAQDAPATQPPAPTDAQTQDLASAASGQNIVVTARRRSELLLDVPVAVTAYSGEQLNRQGALDITDISDTTPNVNLETSRGTNTTLTAFIRGVGQQDPVAGFEQGVGLYLDDVYLNRPQAALLDIYNVERIEILRGPQGTLYGRNTIGGAIKYVTKRIPTDGPHASLRANLGTYRQADLIASISSPVTDGIRLGAAAARLTRQGFGDNLTTGKENYNKDIWAARGTIEFEDSDSDVFLRFSADKTWDDSNPRGGHRLIPGLLSGAPVLDDEFDSRGALDDPEQKVRSWGFALQGEIGIADWLTFKSITAARKDRSHTPIDFDALPAVDVDVPAIYRNRQFSQEFQFLVDKGPLQGVAGFYYLDANAFNVFDVRLYTTGPLILLPGLTATTRGDVDTKTWAVFGDFTYDISEQWSVSLGGRYTNDKRHAKIFRANLFNGGAPELGGSPPFDQTGTQVGAPTSSFDGSRTDVAFTPRASVSFKPNKDHNIYLSYSRGFKGGGFDPRGLTTATPREDPNVPPTADQIYDFMAFDPETVDSFEAGWKAAVLDRRLQFALAVFQANYKDVQVPGSFGGVTAGGVPTFVGITTNAGKARFRGVELETNWRMANDLATAGDRLTWAGTLGYLDAKYLHFDTVVAFDPVTGLPVAPHEMDVAKFRKVQNTPKWTLSGSLDYDTPLFNGRLNANTTVSYRSKSQQFELRIPGLDQKGFALLDANIVWRSEGNRFQVGLHGKNLFDKRYIVSGYNFLRQNPFTGEFINAAGAPAINSTLG